MRISLCKLRNLKSFGVEKFDDDITIVLLSLGDLAPLMQSHTRFVHWAHIVIHNITYHMSRIAQDRRPQSISPIQAVISPHPLLNRTLRVRLILMEVEFQSIMAMFKRKLSVLVTRTHLVMQSGKVFEETCQILRVVVIIRQEL